MIKKKYRPALKLKQLNQMKMLPQHSNQKKRKVLPKNYLTAQAHLLKKVYLEISMNQNQSNLYLILKQIVSFLPQVFSIKTKVIQSLSSVFLQQVLFLVQIQHQSPYSALTPQNLYSALISLYLTSPLLALPVKHSSKRKKKRNPMMKEMKKATMSHLNQIRLCLNLKKKEKKVLLKKDIINKWITSLHIINKKRNMFRKDQDTLQLNMSQISTLL